MIPASKEMALFFERLLLIKTIVKEWSEISDEEFLKDVYDMLDNLIKEEK